MKSNMSNFWNNVSSKATNNRHLMADIEIITDEFAYQIRGGDKDYAAMYEFESASRTKFFLPTILLES